MHKTSKGWNDRPINLEKIHLNDPYLFIKDFFDDYDLAKTRTIIKILIADALNNESYPYNELIEFQKNIIKLIEAIWLLNNNPKK